MTIQRFKVALTSARYPFLAKNASRAVMIPSIDSNVRMQRFDIGSEESVDSNIPEIIYGENFLPTAAGVQSTHYVSLVAPTAFTDFDQLIVLRDDEENQVLFSPGHGKNYKYDETFDLWQSDQLDLKWAMEVPPLYISTSSEETPLTAKVTRAYVDGRTILCYRRLGLHTVAGSATISEDGSCYGWDPATQLLERLNPQDNLGTFRNLNIPEGEIDGVASSNGFLLVWSGLSIHWAPFNGTAFDFAPYVNGAFTGAGEQIPEDIKGPISAVASVSGGFIIFTDKNAVAAFYNSGNLSSPWIFRQISNAGGVKDYEQISVEANLGNIYAYTTGGLQKINLNSAESFAPDASDFLCGRLIETYNTASGQFATGVTTTEFFTKLTFVGNRYLVVSYGPYPEIFTHALIYDSGLKRWGKLAVVHVDCFNYTFRQEDVELTYGMVDALSYSDVDPMLYGDVTIPGNEVTYPKQSMAFLTRYGEIKLAALDAREKTDDSESFVIIGKVQLHRSAITTLHAVEIDGVKAGATCQVLRSVNGKILELPEDLYLREQTQDYAEYGCDLTTGKNFSILILGQFDIASFILHASPEARGY